jgi:hypothetical protein
LPDWGWAQRQLEKRGPGERIVHAAPCKDAEGHKGWLVVTDQRIWYFQTGIFGASEEYGHDAEIDWKKAPFGLGRAMLLISGEPFEMPVATVEEFLGVVRQLRGDAA